MRKGNFGSILIDSVLPEQMRGKARTLDAKGLATLFKELHETAPDNYPTVLKSLADIGRRVSTETGGFSFGPEDLIEPEHITKLKDVIRQKVHHEVLRNRPEAATAILREFAGTLPKDLYAHQLSVGSPMAKQIASGSRGNPGAMARLMSGDVMYVDHRDREVPYPILRGFAEGLDSAEYFGASFGGRKGVVDTKLSVQNSGALAKVLKQAVHKFVVTKQEDDFEDHPDRPRGLPVDTDDAESDGAFLAHGVAGFPRNTVLSSKVRAAIKAKGVDRILVRSPISGRIAPGGGLYAKDVGIRESGALPGIGDNVGVTASDTISEPVGQGTLSSKHAGGAAGSVRKVGGFKALQQTISVPKTFPGGAAHADVDGNVDSITDHPDGGKVVSISGSEHYVAPGFKINVKPGDSIEAGDPISDGLPNPARIAEHQGLGEAKRKMVGYLKSTLDDLNIAAERRNLELVAHGLVNHVMVDDELGPYYPGDVVPYDEIEKHWEPRSDSRLADIDDAAGQYLEHPVLHYSVGTKVRPSVRKELKSFGVKSIHVHPEAPPFHAHMVRAQDSLRHDPDWMTRFLGTNLEDSLLDSTHRGLSSSPSSVSFVPAVASGQIENYGPIAGKGLLKSKPGSVLSGVGMFGKAADAPSSKPKALIVKGNPAFLSGAGSFYDDIASHVNSLGYDTSIHGDEEDLPPAAAIIGHSRGARRVDNLPEGTVGIPLASWRKGSINHPDDTALMAGGKVTPAHFTLTDDMKSRITQALAGHLSKTADAPREPSIFNGIGASPSIPAPAAPAPVAAPAIKPLAKPAIKPLAKPAVQPSLTPSRGSILTGLYKPADEMEKEDHGHGQHHCSACGTMVWQCRCITRPGQVRKQYHDVDPSQCRNCSPNEKQAVGFTAAGGTGGTVTGGPISVKSMAGQTPIAPKPKVLPTVPKPPPQPKAVSGITEGNSIDKPLPGVESNPLIEKKPETASSVSPLTSAAVAALGQPVAQHAGLAGLAALTDFTGHNGSNIQTLLGDRSANPNAYLYDRALPQHLNKMPEPPPPPPAAPAPQAPAAAAAPKPQVPQPVPATAPPAPPASPAPATPAPAVTAPAAPASPTPAATAPKPYVPDPNMKMTRSDIVALIGRDGKPIGYEVKEKGMAFPQQRFFDPNHNANDVTGRQWYLKDDKDQQIGHEYKSIDGSPMQRLFYDDKNVKPKDYDHPGGQTDPRTFGNAPDPVKPVPPPAATEIAADSAATPQPNIAGAIAGGVFPQLGGSVLASKFTPVATSALRKGLTSSGAGLAADAAYRLATGENVTPGSLLESGATTGLMSLGKGIAAPMIGASALVDAGKNLTGLVSKEDINQRQSAIEALNAASTDPNRGPWARAGYDALNIGTTALTPVTSGRAAYQAYNDHENYQKNIANTNMSTGPAIGRAAQTGIAKAQTAGDPAAEMRSRLAAAESDARLSHSTMMSLAPNWSKASPKSEHWSALSDQMADLAKARVMHEHGMKEDGTPMASDERYRLGEAIKQRSAMIQRNQDTLNKGFWSDAFSG